MYVLHAVQDTVLLLINVCHVLSIAARVTTAENALYVMSQFYRMVNA